LHNKPVGRSASGTYAPGTDEEEERNVWYLTIKLLKIPSLYKVFSDVLMAKNTGFASIGFPQIIFGVQNCEWNFLIVCLLML